MSELLSIEWQSKQLTALDAAVHRGSVKVRGGFVAAPLEGLDLDERPVEAGEWLRDELRRHDIDTKPVSVVLPREDAVLRRIEVPDVPDEELPDLVALQAATVMSTPLDRLQLDFIPLPRIAGTATRSVLLTTVVKERVDALRAALTAAGLELRHVALAPVATAEIAARIKGDSTDDDGAALLILRHEKRVDITVLLQKCLIVAHTINLQGENAVQDDARILSEISRSLIPAQPFLGPRGISRALVAGIPAAVHPKIAERFTCVVTPVEWSAVAGLAVDSAERLSLDARYAATAGGLLAASGHTVESVDFLAPRKPPVKKDRTKQQRILIGAGLALIAIVGFVSLKMKQGRLDDEIDRIGAEEASLARVLGKGEPVLKSAKLIRQWEDRRIDWVAQFHEISRHLPGTARAYFTDLRASPPATGDALARIHATGFAKTRDDVGSILTNLESAGYRVYPQEITTSSRDSAYPNRFEIEMDILPASKKPVPQAARGKGPGTRG